MDGGGPPERTLDARTRVEEILVVLSLSLLASAVYSILSFLRAPVAGVTVTTVNQTASFATHLANFVFGLAPAALVLHLVRRDDGSLDGIGLQRDGIRRDAMVGLGLAAIVGAVGLGIYAGAVTLGINRFVVPAPPAGHWWTVPVLVMTSIRAGVIEEVISVGYLVTRLERLGWGSRLAVGASALLRATYHVYQGWGGFVGNLALGLFFGAVFVRRRRTWPLVIAHLVIDVAAGGGYLLLRDRLSFLG